MADDKTALLRALVEFGDSVLYPAAIRETTRLDKLSDEAAKVLGFGEAFYPGYMFHIIEERSHSRDAEITAALSRLSLFEDDAVLRWYMSSITSLPETCAYAGHLELIRRVALGILSQRNVPSKA